MAAFVWLLAPTAHARAEFIPWQYDWTRSPTKIMANAPGTGYIELTDQGLKDAAGDSDIVATNLKVVSTAPPNNPDVFTNAGYALSLFLLDVTSGQSGTLTFTGVINGQVTQLSSKLTNTFTGTTTQKLTLGESLYTVTIGPYTPPGPPGSSNSGAISAFASVTISPIQKTPEPSTLALAGVGFPVAVLLWRRRNKRDVPC
jgi:PEP-CTERM motif